MCQILDLESESIVRASNLENFVKMRKEIIEIKAQDFRADIQKPLFDLALKCLSINPEERPTMQEVLEELSTIETGLKGQKQSTDKDREIEFLTNKTAFYIREFSSRKSSGVKPSKIVGYFERSKVKLEEVKKYKDFHLKLEDRDKKLLKKIFQQYSLNDTIKVAQCTQLSDFFGLGFSPPQKLAVRVTKGKTSLLWSLFCCGARPRDVRVEVVLRGGVPPDKPVQSL